MVTARFVTPRKLRRPADAGWTLVELLICVTLIMILASLALTQYKNSITATKEAAMKSNLFLMHEAIDQVLRGQGQVPGVAPDARVRKLPARDPDRSVHEISGHVANRTGRSRARQYLGGEWDLQGQKRLRGHRARRQPVFRLVSVKPRSRAHTGLTEDHGAHGEQVREQSCFGEIFPKKLHGSVPAP